MRSRFGKLADVRIDSQVHIIRLSNLKATCEELDIPSEAMDRLDSAISTLELFSREIALALCIERGILNDTRGKETKGGVETA